jgi:hypothetical protein
MALPPRLRKLALCAHLTASVGWVGAVVVYLVLGVSAATAEDDQVVRATWIAMELSLRFAIVPLALAALLTGVVMSVGTPWGLFRHYWVVVTLVLTLLSVGVLLLHLPTVRMLAATARTAAGPDLDSLGGELLHPSVGLVVLLVITGLNVFKPRGITPLGRRRRAVPAP